MRDERLPFFGDAARANLRVPRHGDRVFLPGPLWSDVNGNGKLDAGDTGLLMQVPSTEFVHDSIITVAEGALFNVQLLAWTARTACTTRRI